MLSSLLLVLCIYALRSAMASSWNNLLSFLDPREYNWSSREPSQSRSQSDAGRGHPSNHDHPFQERAPPAWMVAGAVVEYNGRDAVLRAVHTDDPGGGLYCTISVDGVERQTPANRLHLRDSAVNGSSPVGVPLRDLRIPGHVGSAPGHGGGSTGGGGTVASGSNPMDPEAAAGILSSLGASRTGGAAPQAAVPVATQPVRSGPISQSTLDSGEFAGSSTSVLGQGVGSPKKIHNANLRSAQKAWGTLGQPVLPPEFPAGPYATLSMHMDRINRFASNPATGGGIWGIREKEVKREGSKRVGPTARLVCNREGHPPAQGASSNSVEGVEALASRRTTSIKCGCPWSVHVEFVKLGNATQTQGRGPTARGTTIARARSMASQFSTAAAASAHAAAAAEEAGDGTDMCHGCDPPEDNDRDCEEEAEAVEDGKASIEGAAG